MVLLQYPVSANCRLLAFGNLYRFSDICLFEKIHTPDDGDPAEQANGDMGYLTGLGAGYPLPTMYVWYSSDCGLICSKRNAGGLGCGFYDEFDPAESSVVLLFVCPGKRADSAAFGFVFSGCCIAGLLVRIYFRETSFYRFTAFDIPASHDTDPNLFLRVLKNIWRNVNITAPYFLLGMVLTALYQRYCSYSASVFICLSAG